MTSKDSIPRLSDSLDDRPPQIRWRIVLALFALAMVLRFAYFYLDDLTRQMHGTLLRRLLEEGTGIVASALFFPIVVFLERRFPVDLGRWRKYALVHAGGFIAYSAAHTTVIAALRALLFPAFGQGPYDYGVMSVRYFMESAQDFFSYTTFLGILTLVRVQQRLRDREVRTAELERSAATARLEALSLRLQPHFLFNALNTISSVVYESPVVADEMIGRLGDLLRRTLHSGDQQEIPLSEEIETLRAYLSFVEARFGDRLQCRLDVDPSVNDVGVPALLLQPLVENAVHHGASLEFNASEILISASRRGDTLELVVENEVEPGRPDAAGLGTGLGATRDRLRLLYGDAAELRTTQVDRRFRAAVRLPARTLAPPPRTADELADARAHR